MDNHSSQRSGSVGTTPPSGTKPDVWTQAVEQLRSKISRQNFDTWILGLKLVGVDDGTIRLLAPSRYVIEWVQENFMRQISEEIERIGDRRYTVVFEVSPEALSPQQQEPTSSTAPIHEPRGESMPSAGRVEARSSAPMARSASAPSIPEGRPEPPPHGSSDLRFEDRPLRGTTKTSIRTKMP